MNYLDGKSGLKRIYAAILVLTVMDQGPALDKDAFSRPYSHTLILTFNTLIRAWYIHKRDWLLPFP